MANEKRLIDANKAVAYMNQVEIDDPFDDKEDILETCVNILGLCPTVDAVEVVHGRWQIEWIYERSPFTGEADESPMAICPFCGHEEWGYAYDEHWAKPYNYCPDCGAKMDGDGNG